MTITDAELEKAAAEDHLPSDITPGIAPIVICRSTIEKAIASVEKKLDDLRPLITFENGLFVMREFGRGKRVTMQAREAQQIIDYAESRYPKGAKIRWIIYQPRA